RAVPGHNPLDIVVVVAQDRFDVACGERGVPLLACLDILTCRHDHSFVLDYSAPFASDGDDLPSAGQIAGHIASSLTIEFAVKAAATQFVVDQPASLTP